MSFLIICTVAGLAAVMTFFSGFGLGTLLLPPANGLALLGVAGLLRRRRWAFGLAALASAPVWWRRPAPRTAWWLTAAFSCMAALWLLDLDFPTVYRSSKVENPISSAVGLNDSLGRAAIR